MRIPLKFGTLVELISITMKNIRRASTYSFYTVITSKVDILKTLDSHQIAVLYCREMAPLFVLNTMWQNNG